MIDELTERIIGCAFTVGSKLGPGFLEKVYQNALAHELRKRQFGVQQQSGVQVYYDGIVVGEYVADLLVDNIVIVELKALKVLDSAHLAQCMNYLKVTGLQVCLLINFGGQKVKLKRIVKTTQDCFSL